MRGTGLFAKLRAYVFSANAFWTGATVSNQLLEDAAREAHQSVCFVIDFIEEPNSAKSLDDLALDPSQRKRKFPSRSARNLVRVFVTGLDREDIEALALALLQDSQDRRETCRSIALPRQQIEWS